MKKGCLGGVMLAVILVIVIVVMLMCTCRVPAGYVAVQYNMNGGVRDEVLTQGWHLVSPTIHTTLYTVGIEQSYLTAGSNGDSKDDESFYASSVEGKDLGIDLTFTYQYNAENVTQVFTRFKGQSGQDVRDSFIKPNIISWSKEVIARYKVADIIGAERTTVNHSLTDYLAGKFEPYGISISNVSLIDIRVDDETSDAINAKIKAQQDAETQAINNQIAIDKANAEAQVKTTQAKAEADALLIEAEAEAEANRMVSESLSDMILEKMYYETWDGKLPSTIAGDQTAVVLP